MFGSGEPFSRIPFAQLEDVPYLAAAMCAPVRRSTVKKKPLRAAVDTSFRGRPFTVPSMRIGVCAESQSCVSCGDVWKYHAILPVETFTATREHVKRLSPRRPMPV